MRPSSRKHSRQSLDKRSGVTDQITRRPSHGGTGVERASNAATILPRNDCIPRREPSHANTKAAVCIGNDAIEFGIVVTEANDRLGFPSFTGHLRDAIQHGYRSQRVLACKKPCEIAFKPT